MDTRPWNISCPWRDVKDIGDLLVDWLCGGVNKFRLDFDNRLDNSKMVGRSSGMAASLDIRFPREVGR